MKLLSNISRFIIMAATAAVMVTISSCRGDVVTAEPEEEPELTYLSMIIRTNGADSRADGPTWGDPYVSEEGNDFENFIDPKKIHVGVFDAANGNIIGEVTSTNSDGKGILLHPFKQENGVYYLFFRLAGMDLKKGKTYKIAVSVNYDAANPTAAGLDQLTFTLSSLSGPNPQDGPNYYQKEKGLIPMFGFVDWTFDNLQIRDDYPGFPIIGTIDLIRAVSKIEVTLTDDYEKYPEARYMRFDPDQMPCLGFVSNRHINAKGRVTPRSSVWKTKTKTTDLTFLESFFEDASVLWKSNTTSEHLYLPASKDEGRTRYIYLPEASGASMYPNIDALRLYVSIIFDDPDLPDDSPKKHRKITGTMFPSIDYDPESMQPYKDADYNAWRLCRNHIYRFIVTDFIDETKLTYKVVQTPVKTITVPDFN